MQKSSRTTTNRTLFALLVATIVIPLPAMTPALLSGAMGAMSLVTVPAATPARQVPIYFMPVRQQSRPPIMVPDTVLLEISEPRSIISEPIVDRALPFEDLRILPIANFEPRLPSPLQWLIGNPGGGLSTPPGGGAVPEPATWAMLIAGFMLAGGAIRRRRRQAAIAAGA